ncbi:hypothetical protein ACRAWC_24485 [Leifsonia sp. L25]|uniref:hypothetical protein n=1 Tax=Leifsonia sp. L25 TaxID=3423957 RepID=UPI003D6862B1
MTRMPLLPAPSCGSTPGAFECQHGQHRREAGRADGRRLLGGDQVRMRDERAALHPRLLGEAAVMRFAETRAVEHDAVAGRHRGSSELCTVPTTSMPGMSGDVRATPGRPAIARPSPCS